MKSLHEIDHRLNQIFEGFPNLVSQLDFESVCDLVLPFDTTKLDQYQQLNVKGVYLFEISTANNAGLSDFNSWSKDFLTRWKQPRFEKKFVSNPKNKRIKSHSTLQPWMPLYIGKSEKLKQRLIEHFGLDLDSRTFAMKLNLRDEFKGEKLRISFMTLNVNNYDIIAPRLEKAMRERYNPIVGQ